MAEIKVERPKVTRLVEVEELGDEVVILKMSRRQALMLSFAVNWPGRYAALFGSSTDEDRREVGIDGQLTFHKFHLVFSTDGRTKFADDDRTMAGIYYALRDAGIEAGHDFGRKLAEDWPA